MADTPDPAVAYNYSTFKIGKKEYRIPNYLMRHLENNKRLSHKEYITAAIADGYYFVQNSQDKMWEPRLKVEVEPCQS